MPKATPSSAGTAVLAGLLVILLGAEVMPRSLSAQPPPASASPKIPFEKYRLPNGMQVILHVDRKMPVVHVNQWFHVGSANERLGRSGFAHLFEHMMFQGSVNAPGEFFEKVEAAGASMLDDQGVGPANGTTNTDRTNYYATVPSGSLEYMLWLEADRLATLPEALTKASFDTQIKVVANELRQNHESAPYGRSRSIMMRHLYPRGHPYSLPTIGNLEELAVSTLDDVRSFFRTYYTPNNNSLVIAGDFDPAEAKRLVEKYFGSIPPGPSLERPAKSMAHLSAEAVIEVKERVPLDRSVLAWHSPALFDAGDAELDLATTILTDGLSSRLNRALLQKESLAAAVVAGQNSRALTSHFSISVTARAGVPLERVERVVSDEIARLAAEGPTAAELARAKTKWEFTYLSGLETLAGKADALNQYNTLTGDPGGFETDLRRYSDATPESVRAAVNKYLNTTNRVIVRFRSEKVSAESVSDLDRSRPPALGEDRPFKAPAVQSAKLDNGLTVLVVNKPELAKVVVSLSTRAGSIADPASKGGLALLTNRAMPLGTKTRKALEIDSTLGALGTTLGVVSSVAVERGGFNMEVLRRNLGPTLEILADVIMNPTFPVEEIGREKQRSIDRLALPRSDAVAVSIRVQSMLAYGPDHPYGRPVGGSSETISSITREDAAGFHRTFWKPASTSLVFVGDVSLDEAVALTRRQFGQWEGGAAPTVDIPPARPTTAGKIYLIDSPGAAQTYVTQVLAAPERRSRDSHALSLVNYAYGGTINMRLSRNLREDKGYTYGAWSELEQYAHGGAWYAFAGVQTDKTKESVIEFFKEMKDLAGARPLTQQEFMAAKTSRVKSYAQQFESFGRVERQVSNLWVAGLPMTELQSLPDEIARLTLQNVNVVAAKYGTPAGASLLLMGDLSKIEAGIRALNLGEVIILGRDGRPIRRE